MTFQVEKNVRLKATSSAIESNSIFQSLLRPFQIYTSTYKNTVCCFSIHFVRAYFCVGSLYIVSWIARLKFTFFLFFVFLIVFLLLSKSRFFFFHFYFHFELKKQRCFSHSLFGTICNFFFSFFLLTQSTLYFCKKKKIYWKYVYVKYVTYLRIQNIQTIHTDTHNRNAFRTIVFHQVLVICSIFIVLSLSVHFKFMTRIRQ